MLTQCPNCQTTFRVTSEILRVAEGQVRCGRCQTQFDALERLIDENDAGEIESDGFTRPPREPEPAPESQTSRSTNPSRTRTSRSRAGASKSAAPIEFSMIPVAASRECDRKSLEEWVEIDDVDDADSQDAGGGQAAEVVQNRPTSPIAEDIELDESAHFESARNRFDETDPPAFARAELDFLAPRPPRARRRSGNGLRRRLACCSLLQAVHHYRATLARHPRIGAPLVGVYDSLGLNAYARLEPARVRNSPMGRRL